MIQETSPFDIELSNLYDWINGVFIRERRLKAGIPDAVNFNVVPYLLEEKEQAIRELIDMGYEAKLTDNGYNIEVRPTKKLLSVYSK